MTPQSAPCRGPLPPRRKVKKQCLLRIFKDHICISYLDKTEKTTIRKTNSRYPVTINKSLSKQWPKCMQHFGIKFHPMASLPASDATGR
ncbi:hypothetical protein CEXT_684201 [Caerostris extrusa]|uniref:Uncharacterized protein n=1 Tax=Caerostris extrusa TaxID=172846 RepID=A0AAV4T9B7_CAEEX|nr:hypothetical protein CEXT_684201 [Caerostris extrusa]